MSDLKKIYQAPAADIVEFECEDVITDSMLGTSLKDGVPTVDSTKAFTYVGAQDWNSVYGGSN